jgi:hypothetical protein
MCLIDIETCSAEKLQRIMTIVLSRSVKMEKIGVIRSGGIAEQRGATISGELL